ncbi:MAG: terminase [Myxococcaceae bacterium]
MRANLLQWQWELYTQNHVDRRNLIVHIFTVPMFWAGTLSVITAPFTSLWNLIPGVVAMVLAVAIQGRTHKMEATPPVPFEGAGDVVSRIFVEQWVTFPRFVLSGGFAKAWRASAG